MNRLFAKWKRMPDAAKSSIAFAISSFVIKGISFLTTPVFTRILDSDQYGLVATYNSWVSILEVFALLGMTSAGVFNVGLKDHREDRHQFISSALILCNIVTLSVFAVLMLLKIPFGSNFVQPTNLLIIMFVHFLFGPAQIFWITRQRYEYKYRLAFIISIASSALSQLISVWAILHSDGTVLPLGSVKIWSTNLALLVIEIPIYIMLLLKGKSFINLPVWKTTLVFAIPLLPHYLAQHVMNSSDKIMITDLYSSTGSAIYSVVSNISMITTILWSAVNASLIPYTFDKVQKGEEKSVDKVILPLIGFYAVMCVGVTLIAPEALMILAPENYAEGIYAVPPVAATAFTSALYNIYANIEFYYKKSWRIAVATIVAAVVNIVLNYLLIPKYGYVAAAYTTLISHIILVIMHYFGYKKAHGSNIYNDRIIGLISVISVLICVACNALYANNIVRYAVLAAIVIVVIIKRKSIIEKVKAVRSAK